MNSSTLRMAVVLGIVVSLAEGSVPRTAVADDAAKPYGLVGDGVADDTEALQEAVDAGGAVVLPRGTYRLTKTVTVDLDKTGLTSINGQGVAVLLMEAAGPAIKFIGTHAKSADPEGFETKVWERQRMPLVDGLAVQGKNDRAVGIEANGTMQLTVTRTHLRNCLHGIHLTGNNRNIIIADCHIYENKGIGVFYNEVNLHQSNITGCHLSYCDQGGIVSRGGNVRNIHITGCDIESNMSPDTEPTANVLIDCRTSEYGTGEVAITGCTIQHNNPSPGSANIRILGKSKPSRGLELVREGNVTITGNVLSDVKVNVHLDNCRGVTLSGNTFWQGYEHNLLVENCSNIVMGPNNLDRNPRYNYGNTQQANNAVEFRDCEDCTIHGLHVTNVWRAPAGVAIRRCKRFNISDCTILDCDNVGLLLEELEYSRVSGCLIRDDREGTSSLAIKMTGFANLLADTFAGRPSDIAEDATHGEGNYMYQEQRE